jgi:CheY-like chemotaxis protein
MPVMDGWTFAEKISKDQNLIGIPIVVVCSSADKDNIPKNICETFVKPMRIDLLSKILNQYCG